MTLAVVIAAYDERPNVEILLERLDLALAEHRGRRDLLFVVDGEDGSREAIEALARRIPDVRVLHSREPRGLADAFRRGFDALAPDVDRVVTLDADLNHQPEEIPRLLSFQERLRAQGKSFKVTFVSLDDDERQLENFLASQPQNGLRSTYWLHEGKERATAHALILRQPMGLGRTDIDLLESHALLQAIMDNASAVIFAKDLDGRYMTINRQYERLFHQTRAEIRGKTDYDIFPAQLADSLRVHDRAVISSGQVLQLEEIVPDDSGMPVRHPQVRALMAEDDGGTYHWKVDAGIVH